MKRIWLFIIGFALIIVIAGAAQFLFQRRAVAPQLDITEPPIAENNATTSDSVNIPAANPNNSQQKLSSIAKGDNIISWNFKGAYTDRPDLVTKAEAEIKRLSGLIGTGTYSNTILYIGIANQYDLLGDGKHEYEYLSYAIEADKGTTGLPWHNLGVLMERLGALQTARTAYEKATLIQPELKQWHYAYFSFLTARMANNTTDIEKEFAAANKSIGQDPEILQLYSEWKNS